MELEGPFSRRTGWARVREYLSVGARRDSERLTAKSAGFGCDLPAGLSSDAARDVDGGNFTLSISDGGGGGTEAMEKWPGGRSSGRGRGECQELSDEEWRHAR